MLCETYVLSGKLTKVILPKPTEVVDKTLRLGPAVECQFVLNTSNTARALTSVTELFVDLE
jgi:hypothetical protein